MKYKILFFICCLFGVTPDLKAQLVDNFSDNNFTTNPTWTGNTADFIVNASQELQLNAAAAGESQLIVNAATSTVQGTTWRFKFRLNFAPSTSNALKIYLTSNSSNLLTGSGYYLSIGETGANDALKFYRQNAGTATLLGTGTLATVATNPTVGVEVTRGTNGDWSVDADFTGGTNYVNDINVTDNSIPTGNFFGFDCKYTSSNTSNFFFDDVYINPIVQDLTPPQLVSASAVNVNTVLAVFDEPLDATTAGIAGNYSLTPSVGIASATVNGSQVTLSLTGNLTNLTTYTLSANDIDDVNGNTMIFGSTQFTYTVGVAPSVGDVIFNEIHADPTPPVSLPDAEYVELYNRTSNAIELGGMKFDDFDGTPQVLPNHILLPNDYILLCDDANVSLFNAIGVTKVLGLSTFPSLTNAGELLALRDANDVTIDTVHYTNDWYSDQTKVDDGWSLELINPNALCKGKSNWTDCTDTRRGTPAEQNSVYNNASDTQAPTLISVQQVTNTTLRILFDDVMDSGSTLNVSNYSFSPLVSISNIVFENGSFESVIVTLNAPLTNNQAYTVTVNNVEDCIGNAINTVNSATLNYVLIENANRYDIIINEIFADPTPTVGLPEKEFVELYNRSEKVINLEGFTFSDGTSNVANFGYYLMLPHSYLIVYHNTGTADYTSYGSVMPLSPFPDLGVSGDNLVLSANTGTVIDALSYSSSWYLDADKAEGGWTLERINPNHPCAGQRNWRASEDLSGGSPGEANSILQTDADLQGPVITRVFPFANDSLRIYFSEGLDEVAASNLANYVFDNGLQATVAILEAPFFNTVKIGFSTPLTVGTTYLLTVQNTLTDCIGNIISVENTARFALPEALTQGDLVINEVLFNPYTGGSDFVELYNNSAKVLNVGAVLMANRNEFTGGVGATENILTDYLLFPSEYVLITPDTINVLSHYNALNHKVFLQNDLPTYSDDNGSIMVLDAPNELIVDELEYSKDWHNPLLDDVEGVSLERIVFDAPTYEQANWHSAAATAGYATPGYKNSVVLEGTPVTKDFMTIEPEIFSPDNDGYNDFLTLRFETNQNDNAANIKVYDAQGRMVRDLAANILLAPKSVVTWDGTLDDDSKAPIGIYILVAELTNTTDGNVKRVKKEVVVAGKL